MSALYKTLTWLSRFFPPPHPGCEGVGCGSTKASGKRDQHSEQLNRFNEMNAQSAAGQHRGSGAVLPFIGLTGSK